MTATQEQPPQRRHRSHRRTLRTIRDHWVHGFSIYVSAATEEAARELARPAMRLHADQIWEATEIAPGRWDVFVSKHEDAHATND